MDVLLAAAAAFAVCAACAAAAAVRGGRGATSAAAVSAVLLLAVRTSNTRGGWKQISDGRRSRTRSDAPRWPSLCFFFSGVVVVVDSVDSDRVRTEARQSYGIVRNIVEAFRSGCDWLQSPGSVAS